LLDLNPKNKDNFEANFKDIDSVHKNDNHYHKTCWVITIQIAEIVTQKWFQGFRVKNLETFIQIGFRGFLSLLPNRSIILLGYVLAK